MDSLLSGYLDVAKGATWDDQSRQNKNTFQRATFSTLPSEGFVSRNLHLLLQ